jgi:hypothetical protein
MFTTLVECRRGCLADMIATHYKQPVEVTEGALVSALRQAMEYWPGSPADWDLDAVAQGVSLILDNVAYQFSPEDEQDGLPDRVFLEDPRANLQAIVLFSMRGLGLFLAARTSPDPRLGDMSVGELEVLTFLCEPGGVLDALPGAEGIAKAAAGVIPLRRGVGTVQPPTLGAVHH